MSPRLLDLFCGAGGAAMGYHRAGFEVVGVDIEPQPRYPFEFFQDDALGYLEALIRVEVLEGVEEFDAIHASPPCQAFSKAQALQGNEHPDLITPLRPLLKPTGLPWVIENVPGAPLVDPVVLEGQMFEGLRVHRPRWFEANWPLAVPFLRGPRPASNVKMGRRLMAGEWIQPVGHFSDVPEARRAMGIEWMNRNELSEAIPPAYTELIGHQLLQHLRAAA